MHILHLNTGFATRSVHSRLVKSLNHYDFKQTVVAPIRRKKEAKGNQISDCSDIHVHYPYVIRPWHKVFFRNKIKKYTSWIESNTELNDIDLVHAHFMYSDGAAALELFKSYNIPYVISVRNTDVNKFMKLRPDLKIIRDQILENASAINFLSPAFQIKAVNQLDKPLSKIVIQKSVSVPNGIDQFWFELPVIENKKDEVIKLLYVGEFTTNKRVLHLIRIAEELSKHHKIKLTLVGGGGWQEKKIKKIISNNQYSFVTFLGRISDKDKLREVYRNHDIFVMLSKFETFGLVYIEALSQGLSVIHTKGQGIDGYVQNSNVVFGVNPLNDQSVVDCILEAKKSVDPITARNIAESFSWERVSNKYSNIYHSIATRSNLTHS